MVQFFVQGAITMDAVNYSNFRRNLKSYFKQVNDDSEPLIITNKNPEDDVVVISKEEYDSLVETLKIQSNEYLMTKIERGRRQVAEGKTSQHELIDPDKEVSKI